MKLILKVTAALGFLLSTLFTPWLSMVAAFVGIFYLPILLGRRAKNSDFKWITPRKDEHGEDEKPKH